MVERKKPTKQPAPRVIRSIAEAFEASTPRPDQGAPRSDKKNYAERLSRHLATYFGNALRPSFPGILPHEDGTGQETPTRSSRGLKKLDVNYSTVELGLGLGVSIKTLNFADSGSSRYTKNYSRIDNELRAEADDYHQRQPYAVLVGVLFLPLEACDDGRTDPSSFGQAVKYFRQRSGRKSPTNAIGLFEAFYVGLYGGSPEWNTRFFDVSIAPPRRGRPSDEDTSDFDSVITAIKRIYSDRNDPQFTWKDQPDAPT